MRINKNNILSLLSQKQRYPSPRESYSPFASNIGLIVDPESTGVDALWLHYNRFSRPLWEKLIDVPFRLNAGHSAVNQLVFGEGQASLAFFDTDSFLFSVRNIPSVPLFSRPSEALGEYWIREDGNTVFLQGYSLNGDARDPDRTVCFLAGVKPIRGALSHAGKTVKAKCDHDGVILLAFSFQFLSLSEQSLSARLESAPCDCDIAGRRCAEHLLECVGSLSLNAQTQTEQQMLAKALHGLLFNLTKAPGALSGHLSTFPNRGEYPTHFLWDTCFQNLAYELMSDRLVKEFLLQFSANQRDDGKYPQFLCSTWARPSETQPALVGWATLRFAARCADEPFLHEMLSSLEKNNQWWFNARMTSYGLVSCPHGLETGQDDSPRFDGGPTLATDMNSYLLNQLRCTAELSERLNAPEKAAYWAGQADRLADAMLSVLYCPEDNLFYDVSLATGAHIKIVSPVSFLPLWAGISLPEPVRRDMIERYLLSPEYLFGRIPFPSVAYNQSCYDQAQWWRGPTWLPEAWLMMETLEQAGYLKETREAQRRLYDMLLKDPSMHELFNSQTGEGLGSEEQGWTCAVFVRLCRILNG